MTFEEYKQCMSEYFAICKDKSVLEIGPHEGIHTKLIVNHKPKYLELIEPFEKTARYCQTLSGVDNVIMDDALFVLTDSRPYDVVVCCGVLYHLHSSIHLLELIVNNCNPKYIILDCAEAPEHIAFSYEKDNVMGNRQLRSNWRSAQINLIPPYYIVEQTMLNLGYKQIKKDHFDDNIEFKSKTNFWVGMWEKI